jgi:hypothetical protein
LAPEYSAVRPIDYSFRDGIALRMFVRLRQEASLQKIRRALDTLRVDLGLRDHLSSYRLVADGSSIYFADSDHAVDLLRQKGNVVHLRDGVEAEDIGEFFPQVSPAAARDAFDFASYVDSYVQLPDRVS